MTMPERHVAGTALHGPVDVLLAELQASRGGLTADDARRRLGEFGPNEPARAPRTAGLVQILLLLANPLVIILLIASAASAILGERVNASIIVLMVALSVVLNFVQTYRSQRAAERLRDDVAPTATVLRDGTWSEIRRRDLVPGDIVRLAAGDLVPADARLLEARGPPRPAGGADRRVHAGREGGGRPEVAPRQPADARNVVFLGTSVVSGTGTAVVVATGAGDRVRRHRRPPRDAPARDRVRARHAAVRAADHATVVLPRALRLPGQRAAPARPARVVPLRGGAGRRAHARAAAHDRRRSRSRRGRRAHGPAEGDRQAPRRDRELRQHGRPLQRQDRHADAAAR